MSRDLHITRVSLPSDGDGRQRMRIINQNFDQLVAAIERLKLTNGLIDVTAIDHGVLAGLTDDDHAQYHTDARALTWLGTRSTTDLAEGTNLYFTDARALAALDTLGVAAGDILYFDGANWVRLAKGSDGEFLKLASGLPSWAAATGLPAGVQGDILYHNGTDWVVLNAGSSGYFLKTQGAGANPVWAAAAGGYTDPLTTDGDIVIRSGGSTTRLGIGTAGQVLQVSGGVPAWGTNSPTLPLTTKGDLLVYDTGLARLGVGTDGQVLTADAASTPGVKWADAAGGGTAPWWTRSRQYWAHMDVNFSLGNIYSNGFLTASLNSSSLDTFASNLFYIGNYVYDLTPTSGQVVGYNSLSVNYRTNNLGFWSGSDALGGFDTYMGAQIGVLGYDDLTHVFGLGAYAYPNDMTTAGVWSSFTNANAEAIGFRARGGGLDTNWRFIGTHYNGSTVDATNKDTGVAYTENTAYTLEIVYDAAAGIWYGYINGTLVAQIDESTEYCPTSPTVNTGSYLRGFAAVGNHATATPTDSQGFEISWWHLRMRYPGLDCYGG